MKKTLSLLALSLVIGLGTSQAYAGPGHDRPGHFKKADANGDGALTRAEMDAMQKERLDKMFDHADTNKDGQLSQDELDKGREEMRKKMREHFKNKKGEN